MEDRAQDAAGEEAEAGADAAEKLLPMRLLPFAPPDPIAEARTAARLRAMTFSQLRNRRTRIDKRLYEMGLSVGEPALEIPSVRGTGLVDIDRIMRKIDALALAPEQKKMEQEAEGKRWALDLSWFTDALRAREVRARHNLLVSELGLALCASDLKQLGEYAPHVKNLLEARVTTARRIDEMFVEMRLVDEEFAHRAAAGLTDDPPKEIDHLIAKAIDQVDGVGTKAVDTLTDLGKSAAKNAVATGGSAVWGIVKGSAKGAFDLGARTLGRLGDDDDQATEDEDPAVPTIEVLPAAPALRAITRQPTVPELIRQLAQLHDDGILSDAEFKTKKAELLARL